MVEPTDRDDHEPVRPRRVAQLLLHYARPHRNSIALIAAFAALASAAEIVSPMIYRQAVNDVSGLFVREAQEDLREEGDEPIETSAPHGRGHVAARSPEQTLESLLKAVGLLLVVNLVASLFSLSSERISARIGSRIEEDVSDAAFTKVLRFPLARMNRCASGALAKQINQTDEVAPIVAAFSRDLVPEVFRVIGIVAVMFVQNPLLAGVALTTLPAYLWVSWRMNRKLQTQLEGYYDAWDGVFARIQDVLSGFKTVKLSGAEARESRQFRLAMDSAYGQEMRRSSIENRYRFLQSFLSHLGRALIFALGGWKVMAHQLTPGDVVMFVAYLGALFEPLDSLTRLSASLQQHFASVGRAVRLIEEPVPDGAHAQLAPGPGRVEFRDVHFRYPTRARAPRTREVLPGREVLSGASFVFEPGTVTALTGPSGTGKTTTADLLLGLWRPTAGTITIDGQDLATLDGASVRAAIGVVAADGAIFRGTVAENIRYKYEAASDAEVLATALQAGLRTTLERLPAGIDSVIGEGGLGLSVGERQRVQIARVLVSRPRILIFDEATANLDFETEQEIKQLLWSQRQGRTTLIIAHRWSMVRDADLVLVLDGGRITERGTPVRLASANGWLARFAHAAERDRPQHPRNDLS
jgi:ABC-type multidrug transport system fused ATPase/permease subunit